MMPLAASGFELTIGLIVAAAYWIFKIASGVAEAAKNTSKPPPMPKQQPMNRGSIREGEPRQVMETEEERTRKFLEALGLPATTLQPRAPQDTMRSGNDTMRQTAGAPPIPPFVPPAMRGGRGSIPHGVPEVAQPTRAQVEQARLERKKRQAQQQRGQARPPVVPVPESRPYDGAIERIHFAELKTSRVEEVRTRSSDVSAIPFELAESVAGQLYVKEGGARETELVALARSPKALRQAILMREILGPPRSLQSDFDALNLAPL